MNSISKVLLIFLFLFVGGCGGGSSSVEEQVGTIEARFPIASNYTNHTYPINVYLPEGYGDDATIQYPVLYMLDAEFHFSYTVDYAREGNNSLIIVAIDNTGSGRRNTDYRLPGALDYYQFLVNEVIPYIDASYSTDTSERTLSGHSFGGLFTGLALLIEEPNNRYFNRYFSQDGSFWYQPERTRELEEQLFSKTQLLGVDLILTGATGFQGNAMYAMRFNSLLQQRNYENLNINYLEYNTSHIAEPVVSMEEFINTYY